MTSNVRRITMFKVNDAEKMKLLSEGYKKLAEQQEKDGRPYILSIAVGPANNDDRSQGYDFVAVTEFENLDDMRYYDTECIAHRDFKANGKSLGLTPPLIVYYTPVVRL